MRNLFFSLITFLAVFAASCDNSKGKVIETDGDYSLTVYTDNEGEKVKLGDKVSVYFKVFVGDSLMASSPAEGAEPQEMMLPTAEQLQGQDISAFYGAIQYLCPGDSALIIEKLDSTIRNTLPAPLSQEEEVRYVVKVEKVFSAEEVQAAQEQQMKEQQEMMKKQQEFEAMADEVKNRFPSVQAKMAQIAKHYATGVLDDKIKTTESGLKYMIEEPGSGEIPETGKTIYTHYYGMLTDGKMFDNSFERGVPLSFPVGTGAMIPGFDEGAAMLKPGGKTVLFLPPNLAYGAQGNATIPPNSELIFYVELVE